MNQADKPKTLAVWYFTTTGNTKHLASVIKKNVEDMTKNKKGGSWADCKINVTLVDMVPLCKHVSDVNDGTAKLNLALFPNADGYVFASMTYCFRIPKIAHQVLEAIPEDRIAGKPFFCVDVNAGTAGYVARELFLIMLKKKGLSTGIVDIKAPSNWFPGPGYKVQKWSKDEITKFEGKVAQIPKKFGDAITSGKSIKDCKMKGVFAPSVLISDKRMGGSMKTMKWDSDKCIKCNLCVNRCPTNALKFVPTGKGATVKLELTRDKCIGCLSCVNNCPKRAIDTKRSAKFEELYKFSNKALVE